MSEVERYMDAVELAELLGVRPRWVMDRAAPSHPDPIPSRQVGRYRRFRWSEVDAWLSRQEQAEGRRVDASVVELRR